MTMTVKSLGNLAVLRTFRVLRALKTVAVVPGTTPPLNTPTIHYSLSRVCHIFLSNNCFVYKPYLCRV